MKPLSSIRAMYGHPYNRNHPISALTRRIKWKIKQRQGVPWIEKMWDRKILIFPDSRESMFLLYNVVMDWPEFPFLERYLRPEDVVVDIGANIGVYVLWMSRFVSQIIAFEPDPENASRLRQQIALNGLSVVVEESAVSDVNGTLKFSTGLDMENRISESGDRVVRSVKLDDYGLEKIQFLKIDVEEAETLVLKGADRLLNKHRIDVLQLEFNKQSARFGLSEYDVETILNQNGYKLFEYSPKENILIPFEVGREDHCNALAIYDLSAVQQRLG